MRFLPELRNVLVFLILLTVGFQAYVSGSLIRNEQSLLPHEAIQFLQGPSEKGRHWNQSSFGSDKPVQQPVPVPSSVLEILQADPRNQTCLPPGGSQSQIPASWSVASRIRLHKRGGLDLIVLPANSCLNGANVSPFWVFRQTPQGNEVVLRASGLVLDLLNARTKKYRDIRVTSVSSKTEYVSLYKFNGNTYAESLSFTKPLE
jgi:hypothetical protein